MNESVTYSLRQSFLTAAMFLNKKPNNSVTDKQRVISILNNLMF